jgi:pantoate--beta-alanine ligase
LSADQRQQGLALSRSLDHAVEMFKQAETDSNVIRSQMRQILSDAGITQVDYVALVDPHTLGDVEMVGTGTMALIAAYVGKTRLIDNRRIG